MAGVSRVSGFPNQGVTPTNRRTGRPTVTEVYTVYLTSGRLDDGEVKGYAVYGTRADGRPVNKSWTLAEASAVLNTMTNRERISRPTNGRYLTEPDSDGSRAVKNGMVYETAIRGTVGSCSCVFSAGAVAGIILGMEKTADRESADLPFDPLNAGATVSPDPFS